MNNPTAVRNLSLAGFQGFNATIYLIQNDQNFETAEMVSRMHRYITQVLKAVRKGKTENVGFWLSMAFSWSMALANRFHIDLEENMWQRFPGRCPYCGEPVCTCKERAAERRDMSACEAPTVRPSSLLGFQKMFAGIYPYNTLQDAAMHLAEEAGEVDEAVQYFMGTHDQQLFKEIVVELVDAVTNMFAVATCLKLDLATEMEKNFADGCIRCHRIPCKCGFVVANSVSV